MAIQSVITSEEVKCLLAETVVQSTREISEENGKRKVEGKTKFIALTEGVFYPNEYGLLLKAQSEKGDGSLASDRLKDFRNKGIFFHGYLDPKYFETVPDLNSATGIAVQYFRLKQGQLPSEALKAAQKGLSLLACGEATQVSFYAALHRIWGRDKFNAIFQHPKSRFEIGAHSRRNPLKRLSRVIPLSRFQSFERGQHAYVQGIPNYYRIKHPNGEGVGFNVYCMDATPGQERFGGLGLKPGGETLEEIALLILNEYNQSSLGTSLVTDEVAFELSSVVNRSEYLKDDVKTLQEFEELGGGKITGVGEIDADKASLIANQSIEEAVKTFQTFK